MNNEIKLYLLNAPILTSFGGFMYSSITLEEAKRLIKETGFTSAIGHESTAKFISEILGVPIPMNRISIHMNNNDMAIVFKLTDRLPEGRVLTLEEMKNIHYEINLLVRKDLKINEKEAVTNED